MHKNAKVVPIKAKLDMDAIDRAKLARLPAPVHHVQEKGKQLLQKALRAVFDNADDALFALADRATSNQDQNLFFESMREVRISRRRMEAEFSQNIDNGFVCLVSDKTRAAREAASEAIAAGELTLVEDDELEELVAVDSMVAKATNAYGEGLQYLSLRLDSLVPQKVYHKSNPFGPEAVCHAFVDTARSLDADIKAKLVLFKLFEQHVVSELGAIYKTLNEVLIEHNILPSLSASHIAKKPGGSGGGGHVQAPNQMGAGTTAAYGGQEIASHGSVSGGAGQHGGAHHSAQAFGGSLQNGTVPNSALTSGTASNGSMANGSVQSGSSPAGSMQAGAVESQQLVGVLSELQSMQTRSLVQGATAGGLSMPAPAEVGALLMQALQSRYGQSQVPNKEHDVINLVKMLFEFILDDRSLAEPMKALIGRLQIPILKVAVIDKTFFSKSGHPARRLLNEMATASLGWLEDPENDGQPNDPLYRKIHEIVQLLLNEFEDDVSMFNDVLADFVSFIEKERKRASILERRTLDAEAGKAKAEAARAVVAKALQGRINGRQLPDAVHGILNEAWSNLLFLICLKQGDESEEWQQALATADDLIWSVTTPIDHANRQHLLSILPNLLKRIRLGMEQIAFNPFELTKLLNQLQKLHLERLQKPELVSLKPAGEPQQSAADKTPAKAESATKPELAATSNAPKTRDDAATAEPVSKQVEPAGVKQTLAEDSNVAKAELTKAAAESVEPTSAQVSPPQSPASAATKQPVPEVKAPVNSAPAELSAENQQANDKAMADIDQSYVQLVGKLTMGTWFEMTEAGGARYRCRLAAIIKATGKYIFVNRNGMKVKEESRDGLAMAMKEGSLRLLDDTMLFDRALESVIGSLRESRKA